MYMYSMHAIVLTVIVDKVRDGDAEQRTLKTGIQASQTLALDDALDGLQGVGVGLLGLDLGSGGEGDQGISAFASQLRVTVLLLRHLTGGHVSRQGH
jgi:hypothetical protein